MNHKTETTGEMIMMYNQWEIHEVYGNIVFVEVSAYASRCLYMDEHCERVVSVMVYHNLSPYTSPIEEIEKGGEEIYEA